MLSFLIMARLSQDMWGVEYLPLRSVQTAHHLLIYSMFVGGILLYFYRKGHYTQRLPWWHMVRQITLTLLTVMLFQAAFQYALKFPLSRLWVGGTWVLAIPLVCMARQVVRGFLKRKGQWSSPTMIIGGVSNTLETAYALHSDTFADYQLKKIVLLSEGSITRDQLPMRYKNVPVQVGMKAARAALAEASEKTYVVLAADDSVSEPMNRLYNEIRNSHQQLGVVPPLHGYGMYNCSPRYFFGHDVMVFHPNQEAPGLTGPALKRLVDVVATGLGLMILAPVFGVIALLIKWQSPKSSVFFKHKRVGKGGKAFYVYKFTSMVPNAQEVLKKILETDPQAKAEWEKDFKLKNDPRILPVGKILRATSLDELPQLWNVLKGDMSLVGPRPIVEDEKKYYGDQIADYLSIKPGVTGLWQVSGRNDTSYEYRVYLDSWYARHWSFWHDIVILLETVKIVLKRSGAY